MKFTPTLLSILFAVSTELSALPHSVRAADVMSRTAAFAEPPRLVSAKTPYTDTSTLDATYYFTLELPANAGVPLQQVSFSQTEGSQRIRFNRKDSSAFEGTPDRPGPKLTVKSTTSDRERQAISVTFDPPVTPGKVITIALRPVRNPLYDGVYLFGVTAFPVGERTNGQFLGYGRFQFYTDGNN
jgi:hypothetical protein